MSLNAEELATWCHSLVAGRLVTAVSCHVGVGKDFELVAAAGDAAGGAALFDLASLTKPLSATLALALDGSGELPLDTRIGDIWSAAASGIEGWRLEDLLRHRTSLRRWMPLYATCRSADEVAARLLSGEWLRQGTDAVYSDLDYILWSLTVEKALGASYWDLLRRQVLAPLGDDGFAAAGVGAAAAECPLTTGREVELARCYELDIAELPAPRRGQVQDGNCRFVGRPLGHAGIFANVAAVWRLAREWNRPTKLLSREMVDRALSGSDRFALGWYRRGETAAGGELGSSAFGHDGFTGGTVWIDPQTDLVAVVLCHRTRLEVDLGTERAVLMRRLSKSRQA